MEQPTPQPATEFSAAHTASDVLGRAGSVVAGRYKLLRVIGEGGMGAVFEAEVIGSTDHVAVKLIKPEYAASSEVNGRFLQEVRAAQAVGHPNIVQMIEAGTDSLGPYMVLELLRGETLCDALQRRSMRPREALTIMAATLDALQAAHAANIVHRDIKPENIFLVDGADRCTTIKLLDFGISKIVSMQSAMSGITRAGTAVGTPDYMSPEQAGSARVDGRADLWSVGAVLYESLALKHPFEGDSYQQLISNIVLHPHIALRSRVASVDPRIEALINRALQKEPADRFQSATAMLHAVRDVMVALPADDVIDARSHTSESIRHASPNEQTHVMPAHGAAQPSQESNPTVSAVAWDSSDVATLHEAPAYAPRSSLPPPESSHHPDERISQNTAIFAAAVVAGLLVLGALLVRYRIISSQEPYSTAVREPPTLPVAPLPSSPQVLAPPPQNQVLILNNPHTQVLPAPSPPRSPPSSAQEPHVRTPSPAVTPPPRRVATAAVNNNSRMEVLRAALDHTRQCVALSPRYRGNLDATLSFDVRSNVRRVVLRLPSPQSTHGRCVSRELSALHIPGTAGQTIPLFHTFR
jgi:eukaryotic-like serine/threonine-protein kinase